MDIDTTPPMDARQKLEASRSAIAAQLARRKGTSIRTEERVYVQDAATVDPGVMTSLRRGFRSWWDAHPVHGVIELAQPALEDYAQRQPYKLVGMAAGAGAALTLLKSWRVLSLTGVALAVLRTSDLKGAARSFMSVRSAGPRAPAADSSSLRPES